MLQPCLQLLLLVLNRRINCWMLPRRFCSGYGLHGSASSQASRKLLLPLAFRWRQERQAAFLAAEQPAVHQHLVL